MKPLDRFAGGVQYSLETPSKRASAKRILRFCLLEFSDSPVIISIRVSIWECEQRSVSGRSKPAKHSYAAWPGLSDIGGSWVLVQVYRMRWITVMVLRTAITQSTGAMRLNSAPRMTRTNRSGRSMNPTLHEPINDSARALV